MATPRQHFHIALIWTSAILLIATFAGILVHIKPEAEQKPTPLHHQSAVAYSTWLLSQLQETAEDEEYSMRTRLMAMSALILDYRLLRIETLLKQQIKKGSKHEIQRMGHSLRRDFPPLLHRSGNQGMRQRPYFSQPDADHRRAILPDH